MKKKFIIAGLVALSALIAPGVYAQQPAACGAEAGQCPMQGKHKKEAPNPFEGLNLTPEQQSKLDALKEARKAQRQAAREQQGQQQERRHEDAKAARAEQLAKIKEILTPEQYVTFLENSYLSRPGMRHDFRPNPEVAKKMEGRKMNKGKNGDFKKGRQPRPERQQSSAE